MTERQMLQELTRQIKNLGEYYWYKDGDVYGGHKKPCDVWCLYKSKAIIIEFKKDKPGLSDNQKEELQKIYKNGGLTFCGVFNYQGTGRDISFFPVIDGKINTMWLCSLEWKNGKYEHLSVLPEMLIELFTAIYYGLV